jgi:alpha-L-arabinofuranosidase
MSYGTRYHILAVSFMAASVTISAAPQAAPSPFLYSAFLETEINWGGEGGLYAEQIRNRDFEALGRGGLRQPRYANLSLSSLVSPVPNISDLEPWAPVGNASLSLLNTTAPFSTNPITLHVMGSTGDGVSNPGYWGVGCRTGVGFALRFYARSSQDMVLVANLRGTSATVLSSVSVGVQGSGEWQEYKTLMPAAATQHSLGARFELVLGAAGWVQLDSVSLIPSDSIAGLFRRDVVEMLKALKPGFMRTPGGSYLGSNEKDSYDWKRTIGKAEARPGHYSPWGYWVTDGLGFFELMLLAEEVGTELQMAVQDAQHEGPGGSYPPDGAYEKFVQGALDMMEFATGSPSSPWGRRRVEMGRTAPFMLRRVEVGNEEVDRPTGSYAAHYRLLTQALWAKYPELAVIASGRWGRIAYWRRFDANPCLNGQRCWAWDDHLYGTADEMVGLQSLYDGYNRSWPKVFVGEYGAASGPVRTLQAAVAEAVFLIAMLLQHAQLAKRQRDRHVCDPQLLRAAHVPRCSW